MEFRTEIEGKKSDLKLGIKTKILTIGSCFSDVLGTFLKANKLECKPNPFGTIFNFYSIAKILENTIENKPVSEENIVQSNDVFYHFDYHSDLKGNSKNELISEIKKTQISIHNFLKTSDLLIITLGTSWVYEYLKSEQIVSNCHKIPNQEFTKEILSKEQQLDIFENIYLKLKAFNPDLKLMLTVSPVRHTKDTLELNALSKSTLRVLCHEITEKFRDTYYFPAYEIMMDDLRDYRFYKEDMIHPNEVAEKYIIEKFSDRHFEGETIDFIKEWKKIYAALNHRPFNPKTTTHQNFLKELLVKIERFQNVINIGDEVELIKNQII